MVKFKPSRIKIVVEHEITFVNDNIDKCLGLGDFWGDEACRYHVLRDRYHGKKAPKEYGIPKCKLFDVWLTGKYVRCDECKQAIAEAIAKEAKQNEKENL